MRSFVFFFGYFLFNCIFLAGLIAWAICARIGLPRMRRFR